MKNQNIENFINKIKPCYNLTLNGVENAVHIAGTNGKGSTLFFLDRILQSHGFTVNSFSSPHLLFENERIKIHSQNISNYELNKIEQSVYSVLNKKDFTYFEDFFLKALIAFKANRADFNLIESGIGAKYDITNSIPYKKLSIITKIGLDHKELLGNNIESIAMQKLAVAKNSPLCVVAKQHTCLKNLMQTTLTKQGCKPYFYGEHFYVNQNPLEVVIGKTSYQLPKTALYSYQAENMASAIFAAYLLLNGKLSNSKIQSALNGGFAGRLQNINVKSPLLPSKSFTFLLDCAHNEDGFKELLAYIKVAFKGYNIMPVLSLQKSKSLVDFINVFKKDAQNFYFTSVGNGFYSKQDLNKQALLSGINATYFNNFYELELLLAKQGKAHGKNLVLFTGSFYLFSYLIQKGMQVV